MLTIVGFTTELTLLYKKLCEKEFIWVRVLIVLSGLMSFIILIYSDYTLSCVISVIQNILLPFLGTWLILRQANLANSSNRLILGSVLGITLGAIPAAVLLVIGFIDYSFLGGMGTGFKAVGQSVPPKTIGIISAVLVSQVITWVMLSLVSAIAGWAAALISRNSLGRKTKAP